MVFSSSYAVDLNQNASLLLVTAAGKSTVLIERRVV